MIVFAEGLSADPKQAPMLHGLIETMIKSPYRGECMCHTAVARLAQVHVCVNVLLSLYTQ